MFDLTYSSEFRNKYAEKLQAKLDPPVATDVEHKFRIREKGLQCVAHLKDIQLGPLLNLSLPEDVTFTDIGGRSVMEGDGASLASSPTNFSGLASARMHVSCSACVFGGKLARFLGGSTSNCAQWVKFCSMNANLDMMVAGVATVRGEECLDTNVLTIESCKNDIPNCVFASCIAGNVEIQKLDVSLRHIRGDGVCVAAGISKPYLNDLLDKENDHFKQELNKGLEKTFVENVNTILAEEGIKPYDSHP
mmetsp:Transcript_1419/g.2017  ORF Transcript_1419/g.2017 Transcript_1419/m.2017 type:complete len:249 (+) Transcript_1419:158-904(+)